jgi:hypothetical protein
MNYGSGGGETSEAHLERLFTTQTINGVSCNIRQASGSYWGPALAAGWFGLPEGNPKFGVCAAVISIDDWLAIQGVAGQSATQEEFEEGAYGPTVEQAKESIENGNAASIPTPVLEIRHDEYRVKTQEGRSRALGAKLGGATEMPIWVAARDYK